MLIDLACRNGMSGAGGVVLEMQQMLVMKSLEEMVDADDLI